MPPAPRVAVDGDRVWRRLAELAEIGRTPGGGVTRLALTDADARGRRLVESWLGEAGAGVTRDPIGNTFGVLAGSEPGLAPVLMGSHIDSVADAGRFDGCLGVVGAIEVLRAVGSGPRPRRPLAVAVFTDEEGARFGRDLLGSSVACGRFALADALALTDADGVTVAGELGAHDLPGRAPWLRQQRPHAYLETHVEQGPVLLREDLPVCAVAGVVGTSWTTVTLGGVTAHAGATPMGLRRDAGLAMARLRLLLHELAEAHPDLTLAVGAMGTRPGQVNVVPGEATLTVDLRATDEGALCQAERELPALAERAALAHGCAVTRFERTSRTTPVAFDPALVDRVAGHIRARGLPARRLWSGAGHDAQQLATLCPAAMIFVRGQRDGISHSPEEWSTPSDCAMGVELMARVALELAA